MERPEVDFSPGLLPYLMPLVGLGCRVLGFRFLDFVGGFRV